MTIRETERIARLEQKADDIQADVSEIKQILQGQHDKYVTKAFAQWMAGFMVSLVVVGIALVNWVKER